MKPAKRNDNGDYLYQCHSKREGGCGGRAIKMEPLADHVTDLLMAVLEGIEANEGVDEDSAKRGALESKLQEYEQRKDELAEEFAEGGYSAREYRQAVVVIDRKMDEVAGKLAKLGVKRRIDLSAAELRESWDDPDFPLARKRATLMGATLRRSGSTRPSGRSTSGTPTGSRSSGGDPSPGTWGYLGAITSGRSLASDG